MIKPGIKKKLSGVMVAGDILLGAVFFADLLSGADVGLDLFLLAFLGTDALLSLDYIGRLTKEEKEDERREALNEAYSTLAKNSDRRMDREMAADISSATEALAFVDELEPEELSELLSSQKKQDEELYRRQ